MKRAVFYVDSHGFGHTTRSIALAKAFPTGWEISFKTNSPAWLFEENGIPADRILPSDLDIHPVQADGYRIDVYATRCRFREKIRRCPQILDEETVWLESQGFDLVLSDISPLALSTGRRAGLPAYGIGNFTWDWIFEPLLEGDPDAPKVRMLRDMMAEATANFRLPFSDAEGFPPNSIETPLLVRAPTVTRTQARRQFRFEENLHYVLLTFGGFATRSQDYSVLEEYEPIQFLQVKQNPRLPGGDVRLEPDSEVRNFWNLEVSHLHHPDLILAVDGVVSKPGYGILSEIMATTTPAILDSRPDFREFSVMVETLSGYPQVRFIETERMRVFDFGTELEQVLSVEPRPWRGSLDGDRFIVETILGGSCVFT